MYQKEYKWTKGLVKVVEEVLERDGWMELMKYSKKVKCEVVWTNEHDRIDSWILI